MIFDREWFDPSTIQIQVQSSRVNYPITTTNNEGLHVLTRLKIDLT